MMSKENFKVIDPNDFDIPSKRKNMRKVNPNSWQQGFYYYHDKYLIALKQEND